MASKQQESRSFVNPMPLPQFFSRVEVIGPVAIVVLLSTWATMDQAASWEAVITASTMIAIVVHQRRALTTRQNHQSARTPGKAKHVSPNPPKSCSDRPRRDPSVADVLRAKVGVDIPRGKDFRDIFMKKTIELKKLYSWLDQIEAAPHQADKGEAFVFSLLVRTAARLNDVRRLERILECMELCGVPISVTMYTELVSRLGKKGNVASARLWFEKMKEAGLSGDVQIYSSLIHACARAGSIEDAESCYKQMLAAGIAPTEVTFNSMVNVCARCRRPDVAEQWFRHMEDMGVTPTVYTYNSMINALARAGQPERAEEWLREMIRRGLHPDVVSFSTIIHAVTHQKGHCRVAQAIRLMREMLNQGLHCPKQMPFNLCCVIQVCARGREMQLAEHWLKVAEESGYHVGSYCYKFVAFAYESLGQNEEAAAIRQRAGFGQGQPVSSSEGAGSDGSKPV